MVQSWLQGRAKVTPAATLELAPLACNDLADKLRRAYRWISREAILCPYTDIEIGVPVVAGQGEQRLELHRGEGYASFVLLPLLNLAVSRRMAILGAPGRGKTSIATLMALLAGVAWGEVRQAVQHGHPQLTIADLLGSPLPGDLVKAEVAGDIKVHWRRWIGLPVKVIDEYNRIPTKTQSALLSLMSEGYAELYEQVVESPRSAWYLTANDDAGGGTFPVIAALKDRIDIAVRCTPFHSRALEELVERVEGARTATDFVPADIIFSPQERDRMDAEIRAVPVPDEVQETLGFFMGQLDYCRRASDRLEFQNKDTLHLAGRRVGHVCNEDCPLDKQENLCTQTENGVSARTYQNLIHFSKALAYFRGESRVSVDDVRQMLPWILHEKLHPNPQSPFFQRSDNQSLLTDRVTWVRQLFDRAVVQFTGYRPLRQPIDRLMSQAEGLAQLNAAQLQARSNEVHRTIETLLSKQELNGALYEDLLLLKSLYSEYQTRLHHLEKGWT